MMEKRTLISPVQYYRSDDPMCIGKRLHRGLGRTTLFINYHITVFITLVQVFGINFTQAVSYACTDIDWGNLHLH